MADLLVPGFWIFVLINAGIYTIFALGLQLQYGVAGLMNFGAVALMGLSAYTMVIAFISWELNFFVACILGLVAAGLGGAFLGLVARRLRGDYFAIVTIAFSETFRYIAKNASDFTGGDQGSLAIPSSSPTASYVGPWNDFVPHDKRTNFLHQIIRRDVWKNKGIALPDKTPGRYQLENQQMFKTELNLLALNTLNNV